MKTYEEAIFYREWIPLPKAEFNILSMLAEQGGSFSGNYSDMMRYLGVTVQNRNRQALRAAIESLSASGYIIHESSGRTQILTVIPKANEIPLDARWVRSVLQHDYTLEAVAAAQVLKLFLWIVNNGGKLSTDKVIAKDLGISESTVGDARKILLQEYENISKKKVSQKIGEDFFISIGQELEASAWWTEI